MDLTLFVIWMVIALLLLPRLYSEQSSRAIQVPVEEERPRRDAYQRSGPDDGMLD